MSTYYTKIPRKNKNMPIFLNKFKKMVNKK